MNIFNSKSLYISYKKLIELSPRAKKNYTSEIIHYNKQTYQQTKGIDPVLVQCWASVTDDRTPLKQHWVNTMLAGLPFRLFAIPVYADPRYEACRNWFFCVFNHFRVCWIQCRAVPSSNIYAKARTFWFKIGLKNRSKISKQHWCQQCMSQYKAYVCLIYMLPAV